MTLTLTLLALWTISIQAQDILYMDHLIAKSCVDRVGRLQFILGDNFQKSYTQLSQSIFYEASKNNQDVDVKIIFGDDEHDPLLTSDCISWSITQVDDKENVKIIAKQEYLPALKATRINFLIEKNANNEDYVAHFELAFLVQSVTQYAYYFSIQVTPSSVVYLQRMISQACEGDRCLTQNAQARILQRVKSPPKPSEIFMVPRIEGQKTPLQVTKPEKDHSLLNSQIKGIIQLALEENQKNKLISPSQIEKVSELQQKNKEKISTQSLLELSKSALDRNGKDFRLIPDKDPNDQSLDVGISSMDGSARANINKITMPNNATQITAIAFSKQKEDINGLFLQTKIKKIDEQNKDDKPSQRPKVIKKAQKSEPHSNQQLNNLPLGHRLQDPTEVAIDVPLCDFSKFLMYRGACIPKQCLEDKLSRIFLQSTVTNNEGQLGINLKNSVDLIPENLSFRIKISYADQSGNEIVSDPINCIDWRLFMIANEYSIDSTRKYVVNQKVQWPSASYTNFDNQSSVEFVMEQTDLERCIKLLSNGRIEWQCYFEFAFVLQDVTQVSYFMCIKICLDTSIHSAVPEVKITKIVQVDACPKDGVCSVQVHVSSQLDFCQESTCSETAMEPYFQLYVNRPFWVRHRILNDMSNWRITQPTINYQAYGFILTLNPNEVQVISSQQGYNIYQLNIPIVADQVLITASGILESEGRILEFQSSSDKIVRAVHAVTNTGRVGDQVEAQKGLQLIEDENQGYLMGISILVCILTIL